MSQELIFSVLPSMPIARTTTSLCAGALLVALTLSFLKVASAGATASDEAKRPRGYSRITQSTAFSVRGAREPTGSFRSPGGAGSSGLSAGGQRDALDVLVEPDMFSWISSLIFGSVHAARWGPPPARTVLAASPPPTLGRLVLYSASFR